MKHPRALSVCFLTEMWERFGFYTIFTLLMLYMTESLSFTDTRADAIMGAYSALIYISPIIGGMLADKIMGYRFAIIFGGLMLATGYSLLALGGSFLLVGLSVSIIGNGFLKPNISTFLGLFYEKEDPRRDSGFTLFYIGINTGVLLATTSQGFIKEWFGWNTSFLIAGGGLLIGLATFIMGCRKLGNTGLSPKYPAFRSLWPFLIKQPLIPAGTLLSILAITELMRHPNWTNPLLIVFAFVLAAWLWRQTVKLNHTTRRHMLALIILISCAVLFWALYNELFFSITLFTERAINRTVFGVTLPASFYITLESIFIILLGPALALLWERMNHHRLFSTPVKFLLSLLCLGLSMQTLVAAIHFTSPHTLVSGYWLILFYLLITLAEMLLSPIGLSMVSELAPPELSGIMMGVWFIAVGFGGALSGYLAKSAAIPKSIHALEPLLAIYQHSFQHYANLGYLGCIVILALTPWVNRLMRSHA